MIKISVPATSANMGCGFDSLGIALSLYNEVYLDNNDKIDISALDGLSIPTDENNLIYKCVKRVYDECGKNLDGVKIIQNSNIPMTRGLGSSSACIAAGLCGANQLLGKPMNTDDIVNLAAQIEGHPDNTSPAILGGFVASTFDGKKVHYTKISNLGEKLKFIAIIPDFKLKTEASRNILPRKVDIKKSVNNISRASLFSLALATGDFKNLSAGVRDELHQPYRLKLIDFGKEIMDFTKISGAYASYLSGAGPTLMAITDKDNTDFFDKCTRFINKYRPNYKVIALDTDDIGVKITDI